MMNISWRLYLRQLRVYRKRSLGFDLVSALIVFLVAMPLCLGIALASGAPLFSGIISGIVGGIVVGIFSSSNVSVSGPAAGMAAIVLAAIAQLGSFDFFLVALILAGIIQLLLGVMRAGFIADYIPSNVLQGLLCAVGVLLIVKQLPLAFTLSHTASALKAQLLDLSYGLSLKPLHDLSFHINSGAMILSTSSLMMLIYLDYTRLNWLKKIPGAFIVVIFGILFNEYFVLTHSYLAQNGPHLVHIPKHENFAAFYEQMDRPAWAALAEPNVYVVALILAVVSSLENLLNIKAGERLDKKRVYCSKDRELVAQGIGNLTAGFLGGIPITSVIVRTSVNIQTGAKTKMSTILHGVFILLAVMLVPHALNKIPLSSLAAILIYTGYKLTNPSIYRKIYRQGLDRFIPFIATILSILLLNLLFGILIGLLISLFFILKSNSQVRIDLIQEIYPKGMINRLVLPQQITFLNKASLIAELNAIPKKSKLIIDARDCDFIDKEIIEFIKEFKNDHAPHKQISLNLIGFKDQYKIHNYIDFINVTTYDVQSTLTPQQVLKVLKEGNNRFLNDTCIHRSLTADVKNTAHMQHPIAVVVGCIDSRVPVETVFDMTFGDLFCIRIAGNVVNDDVLASAEYACHVVGAKLIVVLGHTHCGAIQAACNGVKQGHITTLLAKIEPAIAAENTTLDQRDGHNHVFVDHIMRLNVANTMQHIYSESPVLREMIQAETIGIVGAVYDVNSGNVNFKDLSDQLYALAPGLNDQVAIKSSKIINAEL